MLQGLDQRIHGLLFEVNQDFLQRIFHPGNLGGHGQPQFAQGPGLFLQPLAVALDVAQAHLLHRLLVDQAGGGQAFQVVEGHDMQRGPFGSGQCRRPVERRAVFHQWRDDQHET
ncbi:hypothetical protein D3C80_1282930 [compost metagenome]